MGVHSVSKQTTAFEMCAFDTCSSAATSGSVRRSKSFGPFMRSPTCWRDHVRILQQQPIDIALVIAAFGAEHNHAAT